MKVTDCAGEAPYDCFRKSVPDFQPFNPVIYAIDSFVPLVNLHQEPNWIPHPKSEGWASFARLYLWLHIAIGWVITAVFAASVTNMVKKDV